MEAKLVVHNLRVRSYSPICMDCGVCECLMADEVLYGYEMKVKNVYDVCTTCYHKEKNIPNYEGQYDKKIHINKCAFCHEGPDDHDNNSPNDEWTKVRGRKKYKSSGVSYSYVKIELVCKQCANVDNLTNNTYIFGCDSTYSCPQCKNTYDVNFILDENNKNLRVHCSDCFSEGSVDLVTTYTNTIKTIDQPKFTQK